MENLSYKHMSQVVSNFVQMFLQQFFKKSTDLTFLIFSVKAFHSLGAAMENAFSP